MDEQKQLDLIDRFLHSTTEPYDDWFWDGEELQIIDNNVTIERYNKNDLKEIIGELV
jgi:hypothetical protein